MSLPTAPCTHCRARIVYGQRRCPSCGTSFDYGPSAPPEPTPAQVQEALMAAELQAQMQAQMQAQAQMQVQAQSGPAPAAPGVRPAATPAVRPAAAPAVRPAMGNAYAPVSVPSGAPVVEDDLIDRGRYDELRAAPVQIEDIPGFVDSTLFKAFTPDVVETERVEGLEQTSYGDVGAAVQTEYVPVEHTSQAPVGAVPIEDIPGFVDSTLFKAFTPDVVDTEVVEGLEVSTSAVASRPRPAKKRDDADDGPQPCRDCGTKHERSVCPACGARR